MARPGYPEGEKRYGQARLGRVMTRLGLAFPPRRLPVFTLSVAGWLRRACSPRY